MLKIFLLVIVVIAAVLIYAATRPDTFRIERSTSVAAPPDKVFALIDDLHQFNTWNPWLRKEPNVEQAYEGKASGVGSAYRWRGDKTGSGRMEIVELLPAQRVAMKLDFFKPIEAHHRAEFTIDPEAGGHSKITWAMSGSSPYLSKLMTIFFSMDKMVGPDFEAGLANLKALAEKR